MIERCILRSTCNEHWLEFTHPVTVLRADTPAEVLPALVEVERRVEALGEHAVGFICYEAASGFDPALVTHPPGRLPLLLFGLYRPPQILHDLENLGKVIPQAADWSLCTSETDYRKQIAAIRREIGCGNIYQLNYTLRLSAASIEPINLFRNMAADARYAALLQTETGAIVSASPELFFQLDGDRLQCMPMKGTAARGASYSDDLKQRAWLATSQKNRAENLMITDMVRNDMSRIALAGSVVTPRLFDVERYPTVWQMTSTVECRTSASVSEIVRNLFPAASITGAPKNASMKLIRHLEATPREIYTGTIGYLQPGRRARFSIAIRTAWQDSTTDMTTYGAGGGIVWDSNAEDELAELISKTRILQRRSTPGTFDLLETLLWTPQEGYSLLAEHLQRLRASAEYFEYQFDQQRIDTALTSHADTLRDRNYRVRLLLSQTGAVKIESTDFVSAGNDPVMLRIYPIPINPALPLLYHKTTSRAHYEKASRWAGDDAEALFINPEGYLTESPIANLVFELCGELYTPPVSCGLLPGTLRQRLLDTGRIRERPLHQRELVEVTDLFLINSLRGWRRAQVYQRDAVRTDNIDTRGSS